MVNGDCRIPRANPNIKLLKRDDWDDLHRVSYELLCQLSNLYELSDSEIEPYVERFAYAWRKHISLPTDVETWLKDLRNARANEIIPD